jgi:hypothetical protein
MQPTRLISACSARPAHARRSSVVRRLAVVMTLIVSAAAAACGSNSATAPNKDQVAGAYPMSTARGLPVPHTFTDAAGSKLTIEGGSITIDANGTYALQYKGKLNAITFDLTDEGTYSLSGSTMTFVSDDTDDPPFSGKVQGKSVLVDGFKIAGVKFELGFSGN